MTDELKQLSTYIKESDPLFQATKAEAKDKAVSVSKVIHWALKEYFEKKWGYFKRQWDEERARAAQPQRPAPQAQETEAGAEEEQG